MRRGLFASFGFAFALVASTNLSGCCSAQCDPENAPNRGYAATEKDLADIVKHLAKNECWSSLYDYLSETTRNEHGRTKWVIGVSTVKLPPPTDYKVVDVMEKGDFQAAIQNPANPREAFAYIDYVEPPKEKLHLKLLLVKEKVEPEKGPPREEWRVGFWDQNRKVEAGDIRYWWFDDPPKPSKPPK